MYAQKLRGVLFAKCMCGVWKMCKVLRREEHEGVEMFIIYIAYSTSGHFKHAFSNIPLKESKLACDLHCSVVINLVIFCIPKEGLKKKARKGRHWFYWVWRFNEMLLILWLKSKEINKWDAVSIIVSFVSCIKVVAWTNNMIHILFCWSI